MNEEVSNNILNNFRFKYGALISHFGFTQVPNFLVKNRKLLGIGRSEMDLVCALLSYEFDGATSCPSLSGISKRNGIAYATIWSAKKKLEKKGYLRVKIGNEKYLSGPYRNNQYDLSGLRRKLREIARVKLQEQFFDKKISNADYERLINTDAHEKHIFEDIFKSDIASYIEIKD